MAQQNRPRIVIAGGGTAGLTVAARLRRCRAGDITVIEPKERHHYQPLWTLVGGGVVPKEASERPQADLIPKGVEWLRDTVAEFCPDENTVVTGSGERLDYDVLVVAAGIELRWDAIPGLPEALGKDGVCSNYAYEQAEKTWETLQAFRGGTALFTMPTPPIKCAGAPQKIMYLADDHFRRQGIRDRTQVIFAAATPGSFAVPAFARRLDQVMARRSIEPRYRHNLIELRPAAREAVFFDAARDEEVVQSYDMIHVTPPQGPPAVVRTSSLANADGWVDVHRHSLQHVRYPNVFSLGDASSLPTSKTGAAVRKQAPVLVANLRAALRGRELVASYDGYTSCPLITGYGKLVLAEFDYDLQPTPSFPLLDPTVERWSYYQLKRYGLPALYWHGMLKGRA